MGVPQRVLSSVVLVLLVTTTFSSAGAQPPAEVDAVFELGRNALDSTYSGVVTDDISNPSTIDSLLSFENCRYQHQIGPFCDAEITAPGVSSPPWVTTTAPSEQSFPFPSSIKIVLPDTKNGQSGTTVATLTFQGESPQAGGYHVCIMDIACEPNQALSLNEVWTNSALATLLGMANDSILHCSETDIRPASVSSCEEEFPDRSLLDRADNKDGFVAHIQSSGALETPNAVVAIPDAGETITFTARLYEDDGTGYGAFKGTEVRLRLQHVGTDVLEFDVTKRFDEPMQPVLGAPGTYTAEVDATRLEALAETLEIQGDGDRETYFNGFNVLVRATDADSNGAERVRYSHLFVPKNLLVGDGTNQESLKAADALDYEPMAQPFTPFFVLPDPVQTLLEALAEYSIPPESLVPDEDGPTIECSRHVGGRTSAGVDAEQDPTPGEGEAPDIRTGPGPGEPCDDATFEAGTSLEYVFRVQNTHSEADPAPTKVESVQAFLAQLDEKGAAGAEVEVTIQAAEAADGGPVLFGQGDYVWRHVSPGNGDFRLRVVAEGEGGSTQEAFFFSVTDTIVPVVDAFEVTEADVDAQTGRFETRPTEGPDIKSFDVHYEVTDANTLVVDVELRSRTTFERILCHTATYPASGGERSVVGDVTCSLPETAPSGDLLFDGTYDVQLVVHDTVHTTLPRDNRLNHKVLVDGAAPSAIEGVAATPTAGNGADFAWQPASDPASRAFIPSSGVSSIEVMRTEWDNSCGDPGNGVVVSTTGPDATEASVADAGTDADYCFHVRAIDDAGNEGDWTTVGEVRIDGTPPQVGTSTVTTDATTFQDPEDENLVWYPPDATLELTVPISNEPRMGRVWLDGTDFANPAEVELLRKTDDGNPTNEFSAQFTLRDDIDSSNDLGLLVTARDEAGNEGTNAGTMLVIATDQEPPEASAADMMLPEGQTAVTHGDFVKFEATATDVSTDVKSVQAIIQESVTEVNLEQQDDATDDWTGTFEVPSNFGSGSYDVVLRLTDMVGNKVDVPVGTLRVTTAAATVAQLTVTQFHRDNEVDAGKPSTFGDRIEVTTQVTAEGEQADDLDARFWFAPDGTLFEDATDRTEIVTVEIAEAPNGPDGVFLVEASFVVDAGFETDGKATDLLFLEIIDGAGVTSTAPVARLELDVTEPVIEGWQAPDHTTRAFVNTQGAGAVSVSLSCVDERGDALSFAADLVDPDTEDVVATLSAQEISCGTPDVTTQVTFDALVTAGGVVTETIYAVRDARLVDEVGRSEPFRPSGSNPFACGDCIVVDDTPPEQVQKPTAALADTDGDTYEDDVRLSWSEAQDTPRAHPDFGFDISSGVVAYNVYVGPGCDLGEGLHSSHAAVGLTVVDGVVSVDIVDGAGCGFTVSAVDAAMNEGPLSLRASDDAKPPVLTCDVDPAKDLYVNNDQITVSCTANESLGADPVLDAASIGAGVDETLIDPDHDGTYVSDVLTIAVRESIGAPVDVALTVRALDSAGNEGEAELSISVDANPPPAIECTQPDGEAFAPGDDVYITCDVASTGTALDRVFVRDLTGSEVDLTDQGETFTGTITIPEDETDGEKTLTVTASDALGRKGTDGVRFVVDGTAPTLSCQPVSGQHRDGAPVAFSCTATDDRSPAEGLSVRADAADLGSGSDAVLANQAGTDQFSGDVVFDRQTDGPVLVTVRATDAVGNTATVEVSVDLDNTLPTAADLTVVYPFYVDPMEALPFWSGLRKSAVTLGDEMDFLVCVGDEDAVSSVSFAWGPDGGLTQDPPGDLAVALDEHGDPIQCSAGQDAGGTDLPGTLYGLPDVRVDNLPGQPVPFSVDGSHPTATFTISVTDDAGNALSVPGSVRYHIDGGAAGPMNLGSEPGMHGDLVELFVAEDGSTRAAFRFPTNGDEVRLS